MDINIAVVDKTDFTAIEQNMQMISPHFQSLPMEW